VIAVTDGPAPAQLVLERAAGLLDGLVREFPHRAEYRRELAASLNNLGNLHLRDGCLEEARSLLGEAGDLLRKLVADFPDQVLYRTDLANTSNTLAAALAEGNQFDAADRWWAEAQDQWRELYRRQPQVPDYRGNLGLVLGNRGRLRMQQQKYAEARELLEGAMDELLAGLKPNVDHPDYRTALRKLCGDLADTLTRLGDHEAARRHAQALTNALPDPLAGTHHAVLLLARCVAGLRLQPASGAISQAIAEDIRLGRELINHSPQRAELIRGLLNDAAFAPFRGDHAFADLLPTATP
jgi:tetratricopeptide (TPR) repeat protein